MSTVAVKKKPSEYLEDLGIYIPEENAEILDTYGYVDEHGNVVVKPIPMIIEDIQTPERPYFDEALAKYLARFYFDEAPYYFVDVCCVGQLCEMRFSHTDNKNGWAHFEFEVYDPTLSKVVLVGAIEGEVTREKLSENKEYIKFKPEKLIIKPVITQTSTQS